MNPATARVFRVGDFVMFNDEAKNPDVGYRRSYECAQIVGPGSEGDVVPTGNFQLARRWADDTRPDFACFETLRTPHEKGIRFFKLDSKTFTFSVKKGFFRTPGLPARIEAKLPTACVVAAVVGVANNFGYGTFRTFPLGHHSEPFMPGDRTCNGGAYTFQIPGALAVADTVVIPMRVQDSASIRCIYAYVQVPTTDGQSAYRVKVSRDDGATWELLEYMGIAQKLPDGYKNTYDWLVEDGYGKPATRRLPYNDFGIIMFQDVVLGAGQQTVRHGIVRREPAGLRCGRVRPRQPRPGRRGVRPGARRRPGRADVRRGLHQEPSASAPPCVRPSGRLRSSTRATASRSISWRSPPRTPAAISPW